MSEETCEFCEIDDFGNHARRCPVQLERELKVMTEARDHFMDLATQVDTELTLVTQERDALREAWQLIRDELDKAHAILYSLLTELHQWAVNRKEAETAQRPDANIHKRTLIETWDQVIVKLADIKRNYENSGGG